MAEKFRDEGKDVLLFVDNIYRYTLAAEYQQNPPTIIMIFTHCMPSPTRCYPLVNSEMHVTNQAKNPSLLGVNGQKKA
jgi:F0F1-type ATP synthase beta subunit